MSLIAADLRQLANLPGSPAGRRIVVATASGLGLLGFMSYWLGDAALRDPRLLHAIGSLRGDASLRGLFGYGLMACPLVATWLGLTIAQRQLFDAPELLLWRQAPLPSWRGPLQVLLRAAVVSCCWSAALSGPFLLALLERTTAPPWAPALVPVAIVGATIPLLAGLLAAQIVLVRLLAGRALRWLFGALAALASVGFSAWLLLGLFAGGPSRLRGIAAAGGDLRQLPWTIGAAADLLRDAAGGALTAGPLLAVCGWALLACVLFAAAALLHRDAHERHLAARAPVFRRGGRFGGAATACIRQKEFAHVLQQPGTLIGFLVFALLVFGLARERLLVGGMLAGSQLPPDLKQAGAMAILWFIAVMLVLYAHMGRLALWDGPQWQLYMASPVAPRALLRGKLQAVLVLLAWPVALVAIAGATVLDASPSALLCFLGVAAGGTLAALGILAAVGTWPRLMRPDAGGEILQGGRSLIAAMFLVLVFELAVAPAVLGWLWLSLHARQHWFDAAGPAAAVALAIAAVIAYGAAIAALGYAIGSRNYQRLLAPR